MTDRVARPRTRRRLVPALAACVLLTAGAHAEEHHHGDGDWLVFPSLLAYGHSGGDGPAPGDQEAFDVDLLLTHSSGAFRVLAETEVDPHEVEVERLQLGWEFGENNLGWLGRFHQPASAWNVEHHHGQFLQTSITRPNIEHWEDEGGVIPQHLAGLLLETRGTIGTEGGLALSVGGGAAPILRDGELRPVYVTRSNPDGHRGAWSARLSWLPDALGEDSLSLLASQSTVSIVDRAFAATLGAPTAALDVLGLAARAARPAARVQAAAYEIRVHLDGGATPRQQSFGAGYVQAEFPLPARVTPYTRLEATAHAGDVGYLAFERRDFEFRRALVGLRYDFHAHQALTLEIGHAATALARFNELRLQWSGVWP